MTFAALKSVHATPGVTILSPHLEKNPLLWTVKREAMTSRVKTFLSEYHREMNSNRRREEKDIMADFVTQCQSASFLARGRDGR